MVEFPKSKHYDAAQAAQTLTTLQGPGYGQRWEGVLDRLCRSSPNGFFFKDVPHIVRILISLWERLSAGDFTTVSATAKLLSHLQLPLHQMKASDGVHFQLEIAQLHKVLVTMLALKPGSCLELTICKTVGSIMKRFLAHACAGGQSGICTSSTVAQHARLLADCNFHAPFIRALQVFAADSTGTSYTILSAMIEILLLLCRQQVLSSTLLRSGALTAVSQTLAQYGIYNDVCQNAIEIMQVLMRPGERRDNPMSTTPHHSSLGLPHLACNVLLPVALPDVDRSNSNTGSGEDLSIIASSKGPTADRFSHSPCQEAARSGSSDGEDPLSLKTLDPMTTSCQNSKLPTDAANHSTACLAKESGLQLTCHPGGHEYSYPRSTCRTGGDIQGVWAEAALTALPHAEQAQVHSISSHLAAISLETHGEEEPHLRVGSLSSTQQMEDVRAGSCHEALHELAQGGEGDCETLILENGSETEALSLVAEVSGREEDHALPKVDDENTLADENCCCVVSPELSMQNAPCFTADQELECLVPASEAEEVADIDVAVNHATELQQANKEDQMIPRDVADSVAGALHKCLQECLLMCIGRSAKVARNMVMEAVCGLAQHPMGVEAICQAPGFLSLVADIATLPERLQPPSMPLGMLEETETTNAGRDDCHTLAQRARENGQEEEEEEEGEGEMEIVVAFAMPGRQESFHNGCQVTEEEKQAKLTMQSSPTVRGRNENDTREGCESALGCDSPSWKTSSDFEDAVFRVSSWTLLEKLMGHAAAALICREALLYRVLLKYLETDEPEPTTVWATHFPKCWRPSCLERLRRSALSLLQISLRALPPEDFLSEGGPRRLVTCVAHGARSDGMPLLLHATQALGAAARVPLLQRPLAEAGAVDTLVELLSGGGPCGDPRLDGVTQDRVRQAAANALVSLTSAPEASSENIRIFRRAEGIPAILFELGRLRGVEPSSPSTPLAAVVALVHSSVAPSARSRALFLAAGGLAALLDLCTCCHPCQLPLIFSTASDLCRSSKAEDMLFEWRTPGDQASAAQLALQAWREVEDRCGLTTPEGVLANLEEPLRGRAKIVPAQPKSISPYYPRRDYMWEAASGSEWDRRVLGACFALLKASGFSRLFTSKVLAARDQMTLATAEAFPVFLEGQAWRRVRDDFARRGAEPIEEDQERIYSGIQRAREAAERVKQFQESLMAETKVAEAQEEAATYAAAAQQRERELLYQRFRPDPMKLTFKERLAARARRDSMLEKSFPGTTAAVAV
eukprot:jgi/Botrbrau1/2636/Bobra.145_1s0054.1